MKKVFFALSIILIVTVSIHAQDTVKKEKKEKTKVELKDHVCTDACHAAGKCVFAHGEKGHVCTDECKKMATYSKKTELKDHACTAACKDGKHVYAHGEKGHVCTEACKKNL